MPETISGSHGLSGTFSPFPALRAIRGEGGLKLNQIRFFLFLYFFLALSARDTLGVFLGGGSLPEANPPRSPRPDHPRPLALAVAHTHGMACAPPTSTAWLISPSVIRHWHRSWRSAGGGGRRQGPPSEIRGGGGRLLLQGLQYTLQPAQTWLVEILVDPPPGGLLEELASVNLISMTPGRGGGQLVAFSSGQLVDLPQKPGGRPFQCLTD